jgi:hypothetical protein
MTTTIISYTTTDHDVTSDVDIVAEDVVGLVAKGESTTLILLNSGAAVEVNTARATIAATLGLAEAVTDGMIAKHTAVTLAELNAGLTEVMPAKSGFMFHPIVVKMRAVGGNAGACTLIRVVEADSGNVVLSHVRADMTDGVWRDENTGTAVATYMGVAGTANKALLLDKTGQAATTSDHFDVEIIGYYEAVQEG